jgi:hypothetical protein
VITSPTEISMLDLKARKADWSILGSGSQSRMAKDVIMREIHQNRGRGRAILDFC